MQSRILAALHSVLRPILAPMAASLLVLGGSAGVWSASATSLPGTPLYTAKVGIERVQLLTAVTPEQQLSVHLSVASARLREANVETWAGHRAEGEALLRAYDGEIATAQAILLSTVNVPGSERLLAQTDWELVLLQEERQRLVSSRLAPVAPTVPDTGTSALANAVTGAVDLLTAKPTVSPEDPSKLQQSTTSSGTEGSSSTTSSVNAAPGQGLVSVAGGVGVASVKVNQPDSALQSTSTYLAVGIPDRLDRLVLVLLAQASGGDEEAAANTAQEFALDVKTGRAAGTISVDRLLFDRSRLEAALSVAPPSTQGAIRTALNAIYDALPSSRPVATTVVEPVVAPPAPPVVRNKPPATPIVSSAPPKVQNPPTVVKAPADPTPVPSAPPAVPSVAPVPTPGGTQQSGGSNQPSKVPVVAPPIITSPMIPKPIIVRDPTHLPSPALTGRKPLATPPPQ